MANIKLSIKNIQKFSSQQLIQAENFEAIKYSAYYYIESLDFDRALELASTLEQKLTGFRPANNQEKYYYDILYYWVYRLKVFAFGSLPLREQLDFLKTHIVDCLKFYLNLKSAMFKFIDLFETESVIRDYAKNFIASLNTSNGILGTNIAAFQQRAFKPTVSNWLREYQTVLSPTNLEKSKPGTFHIVKFIDTSQYVKFLTTAEKDVLRDLLDLFNWLLDPIIYEDPSSQKSQLPIASQERFELPKSLQAQPQAKNVTSTLPKVAPVAKAPVGLKPFALAPKNLQEGLGRGQGFPGVKPVNIQDVLNKREALDKEGAGLSLGQNKKDSSFDLDYQVQQQSKRRQAQSQIERKLAELKKKAIGNDIIDKN